ncbi:hypothetical protein [Candidatus Enterovibrio altilux]|uniref:Mobile element protein n=1 Tax=Candidatus Enterovibrio altilux TaxID=1927128 RepID=A0A291B8L5_9GAMM|nr:hypothetical protein [Candidatus Enterovibrio luxaltus]ATF09344.1 hypothetical protein BTN50_0836 [Candidatus Enterovibrio luxaltus]
MLDINLYGIIAIELSVPDVTVDEVLPHLRKQPTSRINEISDNGAYNTR